MSLKKQLGFFDLFCIASGTMISSGLFVLPAFVYQDIGPSACISYVIGSLLIIPAMLSQAELATAMPKAGGTYFFIDRSMGSGLGTLGGLASWFSLSFKSAFALLGIGAFLTIIFPDATNIHIKLVAVGCCLLFTFLNLFSVKHAGKFQDFLVIGLFLMLLLYIGTGLDKVDINNLTPFIRDDKNTYHLIATAGLIFISYGGLTTIANISEEVKNPSRNIPLSMITAFVAVTILYALTVFVTVGMMGEKLVVNGKPSLTPISDGAYLNLGNWGKYIMSLGAILAFVSTGNAGIMTASRAPMAMSRDNLLPGFFGRLHKKFGTPHISIMLTAFFMISVILFLDLKDLVKIASTIMILLFGSINIAVIIMRESGIQNYQPKFKSPFYPWVQIVGIICYVLLLFDMGSFPLLVTGGFIVFGLLWYWIYGRIYSNRESAFILLVKRITAKKIRSAVLSSELKEIIFERDDIVEDRFDKLIKDASILDFPEEIDMEEAFKVISHSLSNKLELTKKKINSLLIERENESSTILAPGLAIPHIVLPGEEKFVILLARAEKGIKFPESEEPVKALFVLAGTMDERNFHLKALASIAQIVQKQDFMEKWHKASGKDDLRDVVLLAERQRMI
jgi:APA family basic amino acid/polyamine antiporter